MRKFVGIFASLTSVLFLIYFFGELDKSLTEHDVEAIRMLNVDQLCRIRSSFEDEVICVETIQKAIAIIVPTFKCSNKRESIDPSSIVRRGYGCCFERALFTEKALAYYGYETRHLALYDASQYGLLTLVIPHVSSHAATEVKTSKGWMGVDSNVPFLLITKDNKVTTYASVNVNINNYKFHISPEQFYRNNLIIIYGLYSRHGMSHGINFPVPEFNFNELLYNFEKL
jgi:hypothetical protein